MHRGCMGPTDDVGGLHCPQDRAGHNACDGGMCQHLGAGAGLLFTGLVQGDGLIAHHLSRSIPVGFSMSDQQERWHRYSRALGYGAGAVRVGPVRGTGAHCWPPSVDRYNPLPLVPRYSS